MMLPMPKSRKPNRKPGNPQPRRPRVRTSGISPLYLWIIVGVLVLAGLLMLARTLSTAPPREVILPVLSSNPLDIEALTDMVGEIELDTVLSEGLDEELKERFRAVDSLIALNDWHEALERLRRMPRTDDGESNAIIEEYNGFCLYRAIRPDHALNSFRKAAAADSGRDPDRQIRLAFAAGYLFQSRGFADSALTVYGTALRFVPADEPVPLSAALYNNLALAYEATGDTAAAVPFYRAAAGLVDTTADTPSARTVRDNLRRTARLLQADPDTTLSE